MGPVASVVTGAWSRRDGTNLGDLPDLFLPPGSADALSTTANRWYVSYAFEQTLWRSDSPVMLLGLRAQLRFWAPRCSVSIVKFIGHAGVTYIFAACQQPGGC
jgi:hypothetical protein